MHRNHNAKTRLLYLFITLSFILLVFIVFFLIISDHFTKNLESLLKKEAAALGTAYYNSIELKQDDSEFINYKLKYLSDYFNAHTIITSAEGAVLLDSDSITSTKNCRYSSLKADKTGAYIHVSVPVISNAKVRYLVISHAPLNREDSSLLLVYKISFIALLMMLVCAFGYVMIYSYQTNKMIEALNKTSKEVTNGNFDSRIRHSYSGEFGELVRNMNEMAETLGKTEQTRRDFIANISHDFRSPLTSIKGFVTAILDGTIPCEKQSRYLNIVLEETERLTSLTNNLLLLSTMESDLCVLEKTKFDIHQIIKKILLQFDHEITVKGLSINLFFGASQYYVFADMHQIQRVLHNLIENALKFSFDGGELSIETVKLKNKIQITIADNGQGIPSEDLKNIWDRFHKADRSRGKDKKGLGLGLSIVKEILKAHEETIEVYSQENKGTKFVFTLTESTI